MRRSDARLDSRSAIASDISANAGSKAFSGKCDEDTILPRADSRNEERLGGRSGVVGRERDVDRARDRERGAAPSLSPMGEGMALCTIQKGCFIIVPILFRK